MKSEAYLTKRLVTLFLVTGELGTFYHRFEAVFGLILISSIARCVQSELSSSFPKIKLPNTVIELRDDW